MQGIRSSYFFFGGAILKDGEVVHDLLGRNSLGPS